MAHKVYVCYDNHDLETAENVCAALEDNRIKCWLKDRDKGVKPIVSEIVDAIKGSKVMVLIYSNNSKHSNTVHNEVDEAFSRKIPILVFRTDDSKIEGGLEFFIKNQPMINAYEDPEGSFDVLVKDTKALLKGSIPVLPIIGAVVLVLIVAAIGYMMFAPTSDMPVDVGDIDLKITDFHVDDVRKEQTSWNYSYFVGGTISPELDDDSSCRIVVDFYDKSGKLVDSSETPVKEAQKVSSGFLFGSTVSDSNNIGRVDVQLIQGDTILAQDDSEL